jgi:putative Mg2+ transporter-C (MgtC) family protein
MSIERIDIMEIFETAQLSYILRMIASCICGVFIGLERKNRAKEAGVRTHCIVACASSLMMLISKYGFFDMLAEDASFDGSRIAAQIVSGIGFLGAGMIFVHKNTITGLTTAAGVWATAGIGMALGAGMYSVGIAATIIILIIQILLHKNSRLTMSPKLMLFSLHSDGEPDFQKRLYKQLEQLDIHVYSADVSNDSENERFNYILTLELPANLNEEALVSKYEHSRITPCN